MRLILALPLIAVCASPLLAQSAPSSLVKVTDQRFAQGCPSTADPLGHQDSTCAINAALRFVESDGLPGGGFPVLYFPHGIYKVAGQGYTSALTVTKAITIQGDGAASTTILNTSPHAVTLTYLKAQGCSNKPGACPFSVQGITFAGQGHATSGGLIEVDSSNTGMMRNVVLTKTAGIALNLQGSSERWNFSDMEITDSRWPVVTEGDTNENYFNRVNVLNPGDTGDYCYSVNCPGGKRITQGVWRPDPHSAVFLDGDNVHWSNSSIKSTAAIGGVRMAAVTSSLDHTYIEGYPWGGQPRSSAAVQAPGKTEIGHLTAAVSNSALDIPVDDAEWQPLYVNNPEQARVNGQHAYVNTYGIFPADFLAGSKEPSRSVRGIDRGTAEFIRVGAFSADGKAHLLQRGKNPLAWPAGSIIEQSPPNGYGAIRLQENHFDSNATKYSAKFTSACSDTEQRKDWTSSPSQLCAEIIAGVVPDGYMVAFPTQNYVHTSFNLEVVDNSLFVGGKEPDGQGWIKIPGNATVNINQGNPPLRNFVNAEDALHTYVNGVTRVQVVQYPNGSKPASALAYVVDNSAGVRFSPQEHFYSAQVMKDNTLSHQYLGQHCWYDTSTGSANPDRRTCSGPDGGLVHSAFMNGKWVAGTAGPAAPAGAMASMAVERTAGAAPGNPVKFVMKGWDVGTLAPAGQSGNCKSHEEATGGAHFSSTGDAPLIVNVSPNPAAQVMATGVVQGNGDSLAVRLCNTGGSSAVFSSAPTIVFTQLR